MWEKAKNILFKLKADFVNVLSEKIILARVIKYLYDVVLLYPLDEFQTNLIFYRGNIKQKHHF